MIPLGVLGHVGEDPSVVWVRPHFVKVDRELVSGVDHDPHRATAERRVSIERLLESLARDALE